MLAPAHAIPMALIRFDSPADDLQRAAPLIARDALADDLSLDFVPPR